MITTYSILMIMSFSTPEQCTTWSNDMYGYEAKCFNTGDDYSQFVVFDYATEKECREKSHRAYGEYTCFKSFTYSPPRILTTAPPLHRPDNLGKAQ